MKKSFRILSAALAGTLLLSTSALACTGVYVGKDVSDQGTYIIARSEDQGQGDYNKMFMVQPRVENVPGRYIEDTATGFKIPLPDTTYKYTYVPDYTRGEDGMYPGSCTNEYGVSISATVSTSTCEAWEKADPFVEPGLREAILAAAVAAVSTSAREAVDVLLGYVDQYGSEEGNTVMITDQTEAWIVEIYGGHQYCAMKMPDDQVAVFGNQNMIGLVDPKATPEDGYIYSDGLFELIDQLGLAVKEGELYHLAKSVTNNTREDYNNMRNWMGMKILAPSQAGEYDTDTFYPLFYTPDEKVSVLTVMDIYRSRYEGTPLDVTLPGQEENRVIGTERSSQIHILQTFPDWPAYCSSIDWLALGNAEHSVFIPFFSGITDTADAYKVDGDTYDPAGAFWMFKRICTIAEQNRTLYGQSVKDFWKLQETLMYETMLEEAPNMLAKYQESRAAGDAYVTQLGIDMAEHEMKLSDNLYAKLLTTMMHNTGLAAGKTPTTFLADVPLREVAESKGYTVTWNAADGSTTITKGTASYTFTPESYICKVAGGEDVELTHYCYVRDGLTYIPMDFANQL
ncbi:peptidase C69 [Flavonifractor sp. An82]|uniref:C69 family dipeptidase n=1 Tax=Flavonifractor sp. An82 TaxID=1965660 RepID=UPI000B38650D|nr:C69 family dipeptidase [Flavonifractor sp. An82]OUN24102.1 peptidase C69 [Flavonifractor sp. An82]